MKHTPTEEQDNIIKASVETTDNLLISALAGAAKTSTLVMVANSLPSTIMLSLAFNKRIAVEMKDRLPSNVMCKTLNALGHGVWAQACSQRLVLNTKKSYEILKNLVDGLKRSEKSDAYESFSETLKLISKAKLSGYIPASFPTG